MTKKLIITEFKVVQTTINNITHYNIVSKINKKLLGLIPYSYWFKNNHNYKSEEIAINSMKYYWPNAKQIKL